MLLIMLLLILFLIFYPHVKSLFNLNFSLLLLKILDISNFLTHWMRKPTISSSSAFTFFKLIANLFFLFHFTFMVKLLLFVAFFLTVIRLVALFPTVVAFISTMSFIRAIKGFMSKPPTLITLSVIFISPFPIHFL